VNSKLSLTAPDRPLRISPVPHLDQRRFRESYERHLARLLKTGETAAVAGLWDHFAPLVRGLLQRALGPVEDVEAALHDVFVRVHRQRHRLPDPARLRRFVVGVAVDRLRVRLRGRRWARLVARLLGRRSWTDHQLADGGPVTANRLVLARLYQALDRLNALERITFALHYFEGLDAAECALLTRSSTAALDRRLRAARRKLGAAGLAPALDEPLTETDLHRLGRLARAASSRPLSPGTARATRTLYLRQIAGTAEQR
jgi:RNA polymerase sigma factor (sigma-70 family)